MLKILSNKEYNDLLERLDLYRTNFEQADEKFQMKCEECEELKKHLSEYNEIEIQSVPLEKIESKLKKIPFDSREGLIEYLKYYGTALAVESLKSDSVEDIKFRDGWFAVIKTLIKVLETTKERKKIDPITGA